MADDDVGDERGAGDQEPVIANGFAHHVDGDDFHYEAAEMRIPAFRFPVGYGGDSIVKQTKQIVVYSLRPEIRRYPGGLCICLTEARLADRSSMKAASQTSSLRNALCVPQMNASSSFLKRTFPYMRFVYDFGYSQKNAYPLEELEGVLEEQRLEDVIRTAADEELEQDGIPNASAAERTKKFEELKRRAKAYWEKMKARVNFYVINFCAWATFHLLDRFYSSVQFHPGQVQVIKDLTTESPYPIVYLPLHKSHFDYIVFTWMLYRTGLRMPIQAAGENLDIFLFGYVINRMGGYFIRRRLDKESGSKDVIYRKLLELYLETLLEKSFDLGFFLEGTRSRTGKPLIPKGGLLSAVVKALRDGKIDDAWLVPVGMSYERTVEEGYVNEVLGKPKVPENFFSTMWSFFKLFFSWKKCNMRMDMGEPMSLVGFIKKHKHAFESLTDEEIANLALADPARPIFSGRPQDCEYVGRAAGMPRTYTGPLYGLDYVDERERFLVSNLAKHMVYDASRCCAVMSTHILATVVLYGMPASGSSYSEALTNFEWICGQFGKPRDWWFRDLGFRAPPEVAFKYALDLYGRGVVPVKNVGDVKTGGCVPWICPPKSPASLLKLSFDANNLVVSLYMESIVATSIGVFVGKNIMSSRWMDDLRKSRSSLEDTKFNLDKKNSRLKFRRDRLSDLSIGLMELLDFETVIKPPCKASIDRLNEVYGYFCQDEEILQNAGKERFLDERNEELYPMRDRFLDEDDMDGDNRREEDVYGVMLLPESLRKLEFFQRILKPVIATYCYSFEMAVDKGANGGRFTEKEFEEACIKHMSARVAAGTEPEQLCVNAFTVKNSLKLWAKWRLLDSREENGERIFYRHESLTANESLLDEIAARVFVYRI